MEPERRRAVAEQRVVERAQRERLALLLLVVLPQLQQHQLADACRRGTSDRTCRARLRAARCASSMNASSRKNRTPCSTDMSSVCSLMPTMKRARRMSASASWPSLTPWSLAAEPGLDHHLLAVVRPAFDERRRREQDRLAHLRFDPAQVLVVQEVARDTPRGSRSTRASGSCSRAGARPAARAATTDRRRSGSSRRASACVSNGPGRPHAGERPAVEVGRRRDGDRLARRQRDDRLPLEERLRARRAARGAASTSSPGRRMLAPWCCAHASSGSPPFMRAGERPERFLRRRAARASRSPAADRPACAMPFFELQLLLELARGPSRNDARAFGATSVSRYSM